MRNAPHSGQDVIDARDIQARIEELETERQELSLATLDVLQDNSSTAVQELQDWEHDNAEELKELQSVIDETGTDASLINEGYFKHYAQEFAEDIGAIENCGSWPTNCIDWEQATWELKRDYSEVDFGGTTFYYQQ